MSILIKGMEMPKSCDECRIMVFEDTNCVPELFCGCPIVFNAHPQSVEHRPDYCPLIELPPHGDLIDRDALIKDGWLSLYKEVMRMGGYAIHELPLKNPSIPVIIPAEESET